MDEIQRNRYEALPSVQYKMSQTRTIPTLWRGSWGNIKSKLVCCGCHLSNGLSIRVLHLQKDPSELNPEREPCMRQEMSL